MKALVYKIVGVIVFLGIVEEPILGVAGVILIATGEGIDELRKLGDGIHALKRND